MRIPVIAMLAAAVLAVAACDLPERATAVRAAARTSDALAGRPRDGKPMAPAGAEDASPVLDRVEARVSRALTRVTIPADDFSMARDAVHPDVACLPEPWNGARCWAMYTPYLNSDPSWENPAILVARGEDDWAKPAGIRNPIVPWPGPNMYNSDPDQAFDPGTNALVSVYREVSGGQNRIMLFSTRDARTWTHPVLAFAERNHDAVSPALVIDGKRSARMWYVQTGVMGCTATSSQIVMRTAQPAPGQPFESAAWSEPQRVAFSQPGFVVWHMDVIPLPNAQGYVAALASYAPGNGCASSDVWLAVSRDGLAWNTFAVPVLWRGMKAARDLKIATWYRTAMRYDADADSLHLWPSGMASNGTWSVFHTVVPFSEIIGLLRSATPADMPRAALLQRTPVLADVLARMP